MLWFMKIGALLTTGILTLPAQNVCGKICDGGHSCTVPMDCCSKGCCYSSPGGIPSISGGGVPPPRLLGGSGAQQLLLLPAHWYFWALVAAGALCAACACALWRRRRAWACCRRRRDTSDHRSDPGSSATGSCYAPPHYSRCSSFHQAPPPYSEVASKPDMYPLVISYSMGCDGANTKTSPASYLMVQYFRNYILQPAGSISATSTIDSLSSSFICNAANEANSIIPPPYSCTGSLDEFTVPLNRTTSPQNVVNSSQMLRSVSNITCSEYQTCEASSNAQTNTRSSDSSPVTAASTHDTQQRIRSESPNIPTNNFVHSTPIKTHTKHVTGTVASCVQQRNQNYLQNKTTSFVNNVNMPQANGLDNRLKQYQDVPNNLNRSSANTPDLSCTTSEATKASHGSVNSYDTPRRSCDVSIHKTRKRNIGIFRDSSEESEMCQVPGPNNLGQMNLSLATASITNCDSNSQIGTPTNNLTDFSGHIEFDTQPNLDELQRTYSVANSNTGSDISSLANLGTPDSPPRATSPTVEIRELLDKIQQLPQQKSPCATEPQSSSSGVATTIIHSVKPKRYFLKSKAKTLYMPLNKGKSVQKPAGIFGVSAKGAKGWLSRSAPTTPCAGFVPVFPTQRKSSAHASRRGSKSGDGSPLLVEQDGSDDERNAECV